MEEYPSDILCLQEIDEKHYEEYWKPQFEKANYSSAYAAKTSNYSQRKRTQKGIGNLIAVNNEIFEIIEEKVFSLKEIWHHCRNRGMRKRYGLGQVALVALIEHRFSRNKLSFSASFSFVFFHFFVFLILDF